MRPPLRYRPHHFLCSLGFRGKGYSDAFTTNMSAVVHGLRAPGGDRTVIEIVGDADAICAPCPRRRGTGCEVDPRIARLDAAHSRALGLAPGERITWGAALERIVERVAPGELSRLCAGCQWLDAGYCEAALSDLHAETKDAAPKDGA